MSTRNYSSRFSRHRRIRAVLTGTAERPRLAVYRSLKHIRVQFIDDTARRTVLSVSDLELKTKSKIKPVEAAKAVGELAAKKALEKGITAIVFDRGGYAYHGRIKALAEGARAGGLKF